MNDNEIIKALECCCKGDKCVGHCPFHNNKHDIDICTSRLTKNALDLINRQKAEIETLKTNNNSLCITLHNRARVERTEAIKEFWASLKEIAYIPNLSLTGEYVVDVSDGDNLVKEPTGSPNKIKHNSLCETETYKGGE